MAAQQPEGIKRTDLQQHDLSVPGHQVVQALVDLGPTAPLVKHTHPGEEIIYVLEGSLEYQIQGQPTTTVTGDVLFVPAGAAHRSPLLIAPGWIPVSAATPTGRLSSGQPDGLEA